ncbi:PepSY-associated TM helix domain-containing protein [Dyadobacter psychrotolerans]|uniref:PepSY domain-containing protein n=1 Tax=Dyadobacter psychrotolerans TaxID=2541721 RepID=A0A4R5DHF7_9BACT|nr:PepSY-associated TM helix domain-containing protein [Dyadobacter psychrotolerans]TDE11294.1 PepSY domain-containing protein [Dyadobacter psychrotolerans]
MTFKKIIAWLHLWLGLVSGIIVFIVAFTGCILVFEHEIESMIQPWLHVERAGEAAFLPPSAIKHSVEKALPGTKVNSIWYYGHSNTAQVSANSDSVIYVDPYKGNIVALVDHEDFFHFVLDGHTELWMEKKLGKGIISYATLIFFVLLVSGLVLWWPKKWSKANRDKSFKIKWEAKWKRVNYDLHNVLGFYSLLVAVLISLTGLSMSFPWLRDGVYWLSSGGETPPVYKPAFSDTTVVRNLVALNQVDKAWKKGMDEIGVYKKDNIIISFPNKPADPIYLCTDMEAGVWRDVYLDQNTLKILPESQAHIRNESSGFWLRRINYSLHVGAIGGLPTKFIYFIASLICATLPLTGAYIWWGRRKKEKKKKQPRLACIRE